jgi:hypothetical protein
VAQIGIAGCRTDAVGTHKSTECRWRRWGRTGVAGKRDIQRIRQAVAIPVAHDTAKRGVHLAGQAGIVCERKLQGFCLGTDGVIRKNRGPGQSSSVGAGPQVGSILGFAGNVDCERDCGKEQDYQKRGEDKD